MPEIPEELRRRIAVARAKALGEDAGDIPATSVGDLDPQAVPDGSAPLAVGSTEMPAGLLERVKAARRQAFENLGPVPERNTVPKQDVPRVTPERIPVTQPAPPASAPAAPAAPAAAVPVEVPAEVQAATPAATAGMSLEQAAETLGMPEKLLRRSVDAKARALGVPFDEALAGMLGGAAPAPASAPATPVPAAPVAPAPAAPVPVAATTETPAVPAASTAAPTDTSAGMSFEQAAEALGYPEELFRRSVEAKAKALGVSFDEALAGMLGEVAPAASAAAVPVPAAPAPAAPVPAAPAPAAPVPAAPAPAAATPGVETPQAPTPQPVASQPVGVMSIEEAAAALGMPEKLFRRSVEAKAKALGVSFDQALADMIGTKVAVPSTPAAAAPAPQPAPAAVVPPADVAVPEAEPLAVAAETVGAASTATEDMPAQQTGRPTVEVKQLYRVELVTAVISAVILALLALAGPAPVFRQAGGAADPSKIPWYLVWVAQLFAWMPRDAAGFFAPLLVIVGLFAIPFVDKNPSSHTSHRRFAIALFGIFAAALAVLTVIGLINRPGGFGWPWS